MNPLASIVIPTYNVEKYLKQTLESAQNQSIPNDKYEIIVADDCSKDNTYKLAQEILGNTKNAKVLKTPFNGKAFRTKNFGIQNASGKYIMMLDGDDFLEENAVESTLEFISKNPQVKYSYSQHRRVDGNGNFICNRLGYEFSRERLLHHNFVGAVECFKKDVFEKIGGYRDFYVEDYDFALRASEILSDSEIARNPKILYNYRIHGGNKSVEGLNASRNSASKAISESLKRKEDIEKDVFFSHKTEDLYSYFDWEK